MNISTLISRIKKDLGSYAMALPIENVDNAIAEIVHDVTLPTFSILSPKMDVMRVDLRDLQKVDGISREYAEYLISGKNNTRIAFVEDVYPDNGSLGGWGGLGPVYSNEMVYQNILGNAASQLSTQMIPQITFDFITPNRLRVYNTYLTNAVIISYGQIHDESLTSIPITSWESFYRLAVLDVKSTFYNMAKHYNEIQTAHGLVNIHIDDWADASQRREDLLSGWEDTYHFDRKTIYWA